MRTDGTVGPRPHPVHPGHPTRPNRPPRTPQVGPVMEDQSTPNSDVVLSFVDSGSWVRSRGSRVDEGGRKAESQSENKRTRVVPIRTTPRPCPQDRLEYRTPTDRRCPLHSRHTPRWVLPPRNSCVEPPRTPPRPPHLTRQRDGWTTGQGPNVTASVSVPTVTSRHLTGDGTGCSTSER